MWVLSLLDVFHCCKLSLYALSRKTNEPNLRKWQKPSVKTEFGPFSPNLGPKKFSCGFYHHSILDNAASYHCRQFQGKLINQTWENGKKISFGPDFDPFGPKSGRQFFFFFFKNLTPSVTRYHDQLSSSCTISEKTNDPILRKLRDGLTDWQTDRRRRVIW